MTMTAEQVLAELESMGTAQRIGKVDVDHGETSCKTPDAAPYIEKMWARKAQRAR